MKTTIDYLNEVTRQHPGITNDSKLAYFLEVTRQAVSGYRRGQQMSVTTALRIAQVLDLHPMETISATMYQQSLATSKKWAERWKTEFNTYAAQGPKKEKINQQNDKKLDLTQPIL